MRVLLIDDDPHARALARRAVERELPGAGVEELDGAAARERAELEAERARLLASEREARAAAETASLTKDHFLATLSHELRTPLNAIVGWARLLRAGALQGEKVERALESIERNANAQARLIDDLLDVSAIISGKMSLELRPVELEPFLDAALDAVRPAAEAKSLRLERQVEAGLGRVLGDPDRLQQVIGNLLSNGVKFTPPGGRVCARLERRGERAAIVVSDTGPGIDPAFLPHVFEPFRQGNRAERSQKGLGLGLAIVRRLVELHGGTVHAESGGGGQGASFVVELPFAESAGAPAEGPREASARQRAPLLDCPPALRGLKVLVVDDEPDVLELLSAVLRGCGCSVATAGSAAEALLALDRDRPDVLLSDIAMPGGSGYDLIRSVRARGHGHLPAAAITAYARGEDRRRALLAGFDLHVSKPIQPDELLLLVASLAGQRPA